MQQRDSENVTLLHWAAINNRKTILQYLVKKGKQVAYVNGILNVYFKRYW